MRRWIGLICALAAIALLVWLGWSMVNGFAGLVTGVDLSGGERDPMFAEEAVLPTRPPELDAEEEFPSRPTLDDLPPIQGAPVDKTVEELIEEARRTD